MAGEDPRETVRLDLPQTNWKTMRGRKAIEEERSAVMKMRHSGGMRKLPNRV